MNPRTDVDHFFFVSVCVAKVNGEPGFSRVVQGGIPLDGDTTYCLFGDANVNVDIFIASTRCIWETREGR